MKNIDISVLDEYIKAALKEDIGYGDVTTLAIVPEEKKAFGKFTAKADGIFCGELVLKRIFGAIYADTEVKMLVCDGDEVKKGDVIAEVSGSARQLLAGERTALNIIQHLSGISTMTKKYVEKIKGTGAKIVDTRKTTPGMRFLEKYAVCVGGGTNHRFNLSDGILIKDNHIAAAGSIKTAVKLAKENCTHLLKIEVEVEDNKGLLEAIEAGADVVMLDNMELDEMKEAVKIAAGRVGLEASGNMDTKDIRAIAESGVDIISMGALTHSATVLDISLKLKLC